MKNVKNMGGKRKVSNICNPADDVRRKTAIKLKTIARKVAVDYQH